MLVLIPIDGDGEDGAPREFTQSQIHVGRGAHNDLVLEADDPTASYEHALVTVHGEQAFVICELTANPTYIDGADISTAPEEERQLKPGDIVSFGKGKSIFRVHRVGEAVEKLAFAREKSRVAALAARDAMRLREQAPSAPPPVPGEARGPSIYPLSFRVFKGDQMVRAESFSQPIIRVGRMRSSHLLLDDKSVSRTHAAIEVTAAGEVLLMDLDSSSGTAVNGVRTKKAILRSGDQISFGDARVLINFREVDEITATPVLVELERERSSRHSSRPSSAPRSAPPSVPPRRKKSGVHAVPPQLRDKSAAVGVARVLVRRGDLVQGTYDLTNPQTTIGRLPDNDIQLDDAAVSGKHAIVVAEGGVYLVIDQHSTNGTYLNGERCKGEPLQNGDVIQIGRFELVFAAPRPAPSRKAPKTEVLSPEAAQAMFAKLGGRRGGTP
jgi:pSer/pThr/pTyr-binding forkhead associated (FHA) protein